MKRFGVRIYYAVVDNKTGCVAYYFSDRSGAEGACEKLNEEKKRLKITRVGCKGLGYRLIPGDSDSEYLSGRITCRGCHDCKPGEYTKGHYKRRPVPPAPGPLPG